jgi:hypothetical protein
MLAYQAESDLLNLLEPHYLRAEHEGRTLLHEIFAVRVAVRPTKPESTNMTIAYASATASLAQK